MDKIDELLTRGVDKIYPSKEALEKVLRSGKKLRLYQGFDPSGIQLHIGHMTGLRKLRQWQDLGHHVIFLIGDGTGQAGDPSGKTRAREKYLTRDELRKNAKDYVLQAHKVVRFEGENPAEILYNSNWLNELKLVDILNIEDHFSVQQLLERDIFDTRKKEGQEIPLREFMYPLLQGYDSVAMKVDLELGGSDQTFNMLAGRKLVREILNKEKFVMTTPLLTDSQGKKIGKTEGNVIALNAPPKEFYGMIMSLSDDVIVKSFEYITDIPMEEVKEIEKKIKAGENPMIYKKKLAFALTKMLNSQNEAQVAQEEFEKAFQQRQTPTDIAEYKLKSGQNIINVLLQSGISPSRSEAKRLIEQNAVELDGNLISDISTQLEPGILKVGKRRFLKIVL
ncbi:tyrosine--tRNA ligase [Candidatus Gottesmanbacteria bacterium RIFCSPHIGHO2_01_FULL_39_10]|uniref:Tyrosine--tRNA ligase n=1 Tax=Candidatus Gottesmanbacteria bacterium RIFCSPHIGHO2_01_FULL_39_10 TaxID=1798375 RepID=A0A1F5ZMM6_9BACT|nr:MAG: tyrosine--tRNA ligase [Candidatus Gottesmanbacteria bacterium RIFCSPHIGHO2_01_FULL_39_10]